MTPPAPEEPARRATDVARLLRDAGHDAAGEHLDATVAHHHSGGLLEALRESCQYLLTAFEALDPGAYAAIEELRLDVDKRLNTGETSG